VEEGLPFPQTNSGQTELFDRVGDLLGRTTRAAHEVGVKVCLGSEIPLVVPTWLEKRLKQMGRNPADPAVARDIYRGTFTWLSRVVKPDYYWMWTNEGWTWNGNTQEQFDAVATDFKAAIGAWNDLGKPFQLATCGWVLGPQQDRSAWSKLLPPGAPIACINRKLGHEPIEPTFSTVKGRPAWAIPWLENDPAMVACQPWVKRMRYDAADALRRGCTGLLGIHWRTSIMAANISALAQAGWDQSYAPASFYSKAAMANLGQKGQALQPVSGAKPGEEAIYQSLRWGMNGYPLEIPNGVYDITLKFCEIAYDKAGVRVFDVSIGDKKVIENLDIVKASGGKMHSHDVVIKAVKVTDGTLMLTFKASKDFPCLSGVEITGVSDATNRLAAQAYVRRINVGGGAAAGFETDSAQGEGPAGRDRAMPVLDFYTDFARANFGSQVADEAGAILARVDGTLNVSDWVNGPGNLKPVGAHWAEAKKAFAWVDDFAALRPQVTGKGELERFDQWLATFRATATMVEVGCLRWELDSAMSALSVVKDAAAKKEKAEAALAARVALAHGWEKLMGFEAQATITSGELGTIANLEQRTRLYSHFVDGHDAALAAALGTSLPSEAQPSTAYAGPARLTVLTRRDRVARGEALGVPVIALDKEPVKGVTVHVRPLGRGVWQTLPAIQLGRAVWRAGLPGAAEDYEYFLEAVTTDGKTLRWPASAPELAQTVVVE
jgi:hypothetical protein